MPRFTARERRERYLREYEFQKKTGKPFFPYAILHDTITSLVGRPDASSGIAIIWHTGFHSVPVRPERRPRRRLPRPGVREPRRPRHGQLRPAAGVVLLLPLPAAARFHERRTLLLFGTIIIPTIWMVLLIAWPFIDRRPERRVSRRPVAMTVGACVPCLLLWLTWKGSTAPAVAGPSRQGGRRSTVKLNCGSCHTLADGGASPATSGRTSTARSPRSSLAVDRLTNGKGGMPSFKKNNGWTDEQIQCIAGFISTYAGGNGKPGPSAGTAKNYPATCQQAGADFAATG